MESIKIEKRDDREIFMSQISSVETLDQLRNVLGGIEDLSIGEKSFKGEDFVNMLDGILDIPKLEADELKPEPLTPPWIRNRDEEEDEEDEEDEEEDGLPVLELTDITDRIYDFPEEFGIREKVKELYYKERWEHYEILDRSIQSSSSWKSLAEALVIIDVLIYEDDSSEYPETQNWNGTMLMGVIADIRDSSEIESALPDVVGLREKVRNLLSEFGPVDQSTREYFFSLIKRQHPVADHKPNLGVKTLGERPKTPLTGRPENTFLHSGFINELGEGEIINPPEIVSPPFYIGLKTDFFLHDKGEREG